MEINVILSAIQSAFATSVQQAVAAATAPLVERIAALEFQSADRHQRILVLEGALTERVAVLEGAPSVLAAQYTPISNEQFKAMLEEWDIGRLVQRIEALESETQGENRYLNRDEVNELIAEAIDDHLGTYDHDEYDNHINDDDKHFDGDIEDAVRDALNGTSVTLSF